MMNEAVQFDEELASIYDETRPIDPDACRACFRDTLRGLGGKTDAKIVDVGCGTGRILECLVPDLVKKEQVVGIDSSAAMFEVAKGKQALHRVEFRHISAEEFAGTSAYQKQFDLVICHWLLHCAPDWRAVVRSCLNLTAPNGVLVWLEEDGDLYRALDGLIVNGPLAGLFDAYYESVNEELRRLGLDEFDPSSRAGTALRCTRDLVGELARWGWNVHTHSLVHRWTRRVTVAWIVETVLARRAFTNLRRIPPAMNSSAIDDLKRRLGRSGLPLAHDSMELEFWAKPSIAAESGRNAFDGNRVICRATEPTVSQL